MIFKFDNEVNVYIDVPFEDKEEVKSTRKAWFDFENKKWFCLKTNQELINRYPIRERTYIDLSYNGRHKAREIGAFWDADRKSWFVYK